MAEGGQKGHAVHTELLYLLHIQVLDDVCGYRKVLGIKEHEIGTVLHTQIAMLDQSGIGSNAAAGTLAEHMIQSDDRNNTAAYDILQHSSGSYRRELIRISNQNQSGIGRNRSKQPFCQECVHHGYFVHQNEISVQHDPSRQTAIWVCLDAQCLMDRGCRQSRGFLHLLGCLSGRRAAHNGGFRVLFAIQVKDCLLYRGFSCSRAASNDTELGC